MKPYRKSNVPLARELRTNMTKYERLLWYRFLRTCPLRFQRQKPIGRYIVDFYCAKAKLVIELNGSGHFEEEQEAYDKKRTEYLQHMGLQELRYTNLQIAREFQNVCEDIYKHIEFALDDNNNCSKEALMKGIQGESR
ncbi:endonuclease domain-containing protein [Ruminococcus sp.]|uniref:endonuclease domain-containing protein n=1 Tax=Ruminococcus sp. TaxID=41978 RepID=UPI002E7FDD2D|nr:endonuclease domain-containing protein [Ruminococcus sp.]MEE3492788.1 endonuclease domain-containing protein [Ruminococcus sp.]